MGLSVLIVDDSKLARMVATGILSRLRPDWRISEAENAEAALARLTAEGADLVLIDYNMPGTDGLVLAARIREMNPETPIGIISANAQDSILTQARALDATFIEKPLTDDALKSFLSGAALRLHREER